MIIPFLIFLPLWKKSRAVIIGALFGVLTLTLLIFFTGSRGSLLGLALIIFLAIFINRRRLISQTPILILVIPALAFAIFFFSGNQQAFTSLSSILPERIKLKVDRTINASEQKKADGSIEFRGQMLKQSLKSLLQAPLGQGAGQAEPYLLRNSNNQLESNNPHNPFGEVAINYGFIGLILWSFYFFGLLYALFRKFIIDGDSQIRYLAISCAAALIGFIPASISHGTVWRSFPVMWTIFGLALYTIKTKEPAK
jgi:O-antigen ligase